MIKKKKKRTYYDCCQNCLDQYGEVHRTMLMAMGGISMHKARPQAIKALSKAKKRLEENDETQEEFDKNLNSAIEDADYAEKQIKQGFPILVSMSIVVLWSYLETTVNDVAINWLVETRFKTLNDDTKKLSVPFSDMQNSSLKQRAALLIDSLVRKKGRMHPVAKFEYILDAIGLGGILSDKLKNNLHEFSQVRNLCVHKVGKVDAKFKRECPSMKCRIGSVLRISPDDVLRFLDSGADYSATIAERCRAKEEELGIFKPKKRNKTNK